jgi:hypothetical protein
LAAERHAHLVVGVPGEPGAHLRQPAGGERGDAHPPPGVGAAQRLGERADDGGVLQVDVDARLGEGAEDVLQAGDGLGAADAGPGDLGVGEPGDGAGAVGDAVEGAVVEGDDDPVGGGVGVGLQIAVAEVDGALERRHRVLRAPGRAAAVGEGDRAGMVEEFVRAPHPSDYGGPRHPS